MLSLLLIATIFAAQTPADPPPAPPAPTYHGHAMSLGLRIAHTIGHGWTVGVVLSGLVSPRASYGEYELEFPTVGAAASVDWVLGTKSFVRLGLGAQAMYFLGGLTIGPALLFEPTTISWGFEASPFVAIGAPLPDPNCTELNGGPAAVTYYRFSLFEGPRILHDYGGMLAAFFVRGGLICSL